MSDGPSSIMDDTTEDQQTSIITADASESEDNVPAVAVEEEPEVMTSRNIPAASESTTTAAAADAIAATTTTTPVATRALVDTTGVVVDGESATATATTTVALTPTNSGDDSEQQQQQQETVNNNTSDNDDNNNDGAVTPIPNVSVPPIVPSLLREWRPPQVGSNNDNGSDSNNNNNVSSDDAAEAEVEAAPITNTPVASRTTTTGSTGNTPVAPVEAVVLGERVDTATINAEAAAAATAAEATATTPGTSSSSTSSATAAISRTSLPQYSYPVATFVSNFVRDHIYASASAVPEVGDSDGGATGGATAANGSAASGIGRAAMGIHTLARSSVASATAITGSTRSEPATPTMVATVDPTSFMGMTGTSTPAALSLSMDSTGTAATRGESTATAAATATSLTAQQMAEAAIRDLDHDSLPANHNYVLVDGDLIAIPADDIEDEYDDDHGSNDHNHDYDDDDDELADRHAESYLDRHDRSNNKGSRMQRGVRKFKKWKRGLRNRITGFKKHRHQQPQENKGQDHDSQPPPSRHAADGTGTVGSTAGSNDNDSTVQLHGEPAAGPLMTDDETSAQFSIGTHFSHQLPGGAGTGAGTSTDDDSSTIATNTAPSISEVSHVSSSPGRHRAQKHQLKKHHPRKKKNLLGWPRSDRSIQSSSSSSLIQSSSPSVGSGRTTGSGASNSAHPTMVQSAGGRPNVISLQAYSSSYDGGGLQMDDASSIASSAAASIAPSVTAPPPSMVGRAAMPTLTETSVEIPTPAASLTLDAATATATASAASSASPFASLSTYPGGADPPLVPDAHSFHRSSSIAAEASFVGNADSLTYMEAGVLPADAAGVMMPAELTYIEDRLDDYDKYDKKDDALMYYDPYLKDMVRPTADFKVDKQDAPCVDSMLRMADRYTQDLEDRDVENEPPLISSLKAAPGKSAQGEPVPLSTATRKDDLVQNDILKLVMVGAPDPRAALARALRQSTRRPRKRTTLAVDVHSWTPENDKRVKFTIWDVQSASRSIPDDPSPNFGAHPGTQSLFFSDRALYVLCWDMGVNNYKTYRNFDRLPGKGNMFDDDDDYDDEDERENDYTREEANKQADRALQTDIEDRVLTWVDCVARRGSHSAVLPIALLPSDMSDEEAKRRCNAMQNLLMIHTERNFPADLVPPKVLCGEETVMCVSLETGMGLDLLQEMIIDIATDSDHSVFDHILTPVPYGTVAVMETVRRLKSSHKLVLVDHLMGELPYGVELTADAVMVCLNFLSSIGEVLYFNEEMLSHYVILSRKWLVSALSCILRNDLKRELAETRRFMNMQCLYSDQRYNESNVIQTFNAHSSNCPVLSSQDATMLWQSMSFMREAADRSSQLSESSTTTQTMFGFLERLLVYTGVFLPLDIDKFSSQDTIYFVPSLLSQSTEKDIWTYKNGEAYLSTLCHTFLFREGTTVGLMEQVIVSLLRDLYEFSHVVAVKPVPSTPHNPPARSQTFPFGQASFNDFMGTHDGDPIGQIKIHQVVCWKNSALIKIGRVFGEGSDGVLRESFVEIFVAVADRNHPHSVATDAMRSDAQRLVVSAKGQIGGYGKKIWRGGYDVVLDSIKSSVSLLSNVREVVCPECLAHNHPSNASTWSWDSVRAATDPVIRCMKGHKVDRHLLCGTIPATPKLEEGSKPPGGHTMTLKELLPAVVLVGLWDDDTKTIHNIGSGFIADKTLGLVVTAGHIMFTMEEGRNFGAPYKGLQHGRAIIGMIPEGSSNNEAVFRYFGEIVAEDIHNMDACVLRITSKLSADVELDEKIKDQPEIRLEDIKAEALPTLKRINKYELEEQLRLVGFNQGGEGLVAAGRSVNRSADFARGYICKLFSAQVNDDDDDASTGSGESSTGEVGFTPRSELVCRVPNIGGHSGGPCVNDEGKVVGILSRADPVDPQRCYLVPSSEVTKLVRRARLPGGLKLY